MFRPRLLAALIAASSVFSSPLLAEDLLEIYKLAEQNDPVLRAAVQNRLAVLENVPISRADLLPQLGAGGEINYSHTHILGTGGTTIDGVGRNLGLNLSQTLYNRTRTLQLDVAEAQVQQADIDYAFVEQQLILRVGQAYFNVLKANAQLQLARADLAAVQRQLEQAQQRFEVGLIAITDVAAAQAEFDRARAQTLSAENALNNAFSQLSTLTGQTHTSLADVRTDLLTPEPQPRDIERWIEVALEQNLSLRSAEIGTEIAQRVIDINRSVRMPTVNLNANYGYNKSPSQISGRDVESRSGSLGVQVSVPLYTGGRINAQTRQATYRFQEARDQLEALRRQVRRDTETAYRNVITNISEIEAYRQAVESARTSLAATEAGYEVGTRTIVDVLNAERQVFAAMSQYLNARYNYILNNLQLKWASGQLSRADLIAINEQLEEGEINPLIAPLMDERDNDMDFQQRLMPQS